MAPSVGPLRGVRVVEIANYVSVPFATMMLADLGADVVKVEPPAGDPFRRFGRPRQAVSPVFANVNRGKQTVALDLKATPDRERLLALLDGADVMVSNWRPGVAERLGLDDAVLTARNPRLLRVYVTGFGTSGPYADRPTFDSIVQALSGLTWAQGGDGPPQFAAGYLVDKLTAAMVAQAMLAGLYERAASGAGHAIEVSMLDAAAYFNFPELFANRTYVDDQPPDARFRQAAALRPLRAADGWFVISAVSGDQIRAAMAAIGAPDRAAELLRERDGEQLVRRINDTVEAHTSTRTLDECLAAFAAFDVPAAPCLDLDQHLADPQVAHNEIYEIVDDPELGRLRRVRYPARSEGWDCATVPHDRRAE